jgi:acyl carrier protein
MDEQSILGELSDIIVKRLKFDPGRLAAVSLLTPLPKGVEGSLGLDSLDFIELSIALEERFGLVIQEDADVSAHFATLGSLVRFVQAAAGGAGRGSTADGP